MDKQGFLIINNSVVIDSSTSITSLPDNAIVEEFATRDEMYQEAFDRGLIDEIPAKEVVPESVSIRQAKLQLLAMGLTQDMVDKFFISASKL